MEMCSNNNFAVIAVTRMHQFARLSEMMEAAVFMVIIISTAYTIFSFIMLC